MKHLDPEAFTIRAGIPLGPVSVESYRSPDFHKREASQVFGRAWLLIGRVEDLPRAGSYVVREIEVARASVLVTRNRQGKINAFHNVCSHRGNQVAWDKAGTASVLRCRYHNWAYSTDGDLLAVPDSEEFFFLEKGRCGLTPIHCQVWQGWIFINLQAEPEVGLIEFLGGMASYLDGVSYPFTTNSLVFEADLNCNWKVVSDAFVEAYHIPALHHKTIGPSFSSSNNPRAHLLDAKFFGPHRVVSMYGNPDFRPHPEKEEIATLALGGIHPDRTSIASATEASKDFFEHAAVNPTKSNHWSMDVNFVFPNTHIDFGPTGLFTHQFWPLDYNRTRHEICFYTPEARTAADRFQQEHMLARFYEVLLEDVSNVERTQRGLESRAKDVMLLQDNEVGIRHSVHHIEKWAAAATVAEALS